MIIHISDQHVDVQTGEYHCKPRGFNFNSSLCIHSKERWTQMPTRVSPSDPHTRTGSPCKLCILICSLLLLPIFYALFSWAPQLSLSTLILLHASYTRNLLVDETHPIFHTSCSCSASTHTRSVPRPSKQPHPLLFRSTLIQTPNPTLNHTTQGACSSRGLQALPSL